MIDYPAARAVAMIVQTGSFERAAQALNVTPSAVSQRVKQLEERLGAVLIERGIPCTATEKGAWLCRHMEHVGMLEKDLMEHLPGLVDPAAPMQRVTLNIATNADSLGTWFLGAASAFTRGSDYLLNIAIDDEDHTADWLRRGRVLAAVTSLAKPVQGCHVRPLGRLRYHATASPDYVERHFPAGVTPEAIAYAPALTFNQKDRLQHEWIRQDARSKRHLSHPLAGIDAELRRCQPRRDGVGPEPGSTRQGPPGIGSTGGAGSRRDPGQTALLAGEPSRRRPALRSDPECRGHGEA